VPSIIEVHQNEAAQREYRDYIARRNSLRRLRRSRQLSLPRIVVPTVVYLPVENERPVSQNTHNESALNANPPSPSPSVCSLPTYDILFPSGSSDDPQLPTYEEAIASAPIQHQNK